MGYSFDKKSIERTAAAVRKVEKDVKGLKRREGTKASVYPQFTLVGDLVADTTRDGTGHIKVRALDSTGVGALIADSTMAFIEAGMLETGKTLSTDTRVKIDRAGGVYVLAAYDCDV